MIAGLPLSAWLLLVLAVVPGFVIALRTVVKHTRANRTNARSTRS